MYLDYDFYKTNWGGKVLEEDFTQLNIKATQIVDYYTFNRLKNLEIIDDDVKYAICELIDEMHRLQTTDGKEIASESVATYSVTYAVGNDSEKSIQNRQKDIVKKWLGHTGLLYRGV